MYIANSYFYNYKPSPQIRQHHVLQNLRKNKDIVKGYGVVILDQKIYDNAIQEIISNTSEFEKLNEDPTLKHEASICFLCKLKENNFFNENEYDKLYPPGFAPARIYGTPKMHKISSSDTFPKLRLIVSSIGTFMIFGPTRIYGTPKMHKFSSSDTFPKLCPIVSSICTFIILPVSFVVVFHLQYLMIIL